MNVTVNVHRRVLLPIALALLVSACADDDNDDDQRGVTPAGAPSAPARFEVSMLNLTAAQPFSPPALLVHADGYALFGVGAPASLALEQVAEEGASDELLFAAGTDAAVFATISADEPLPPGGSTTLVLDVDQSELSGLKFSAVTMLVNTNDAFTAVNGAAIGDLAVGQSMAVSAIAYDAGTEANTEAAGTIPGPADGGTGFDAMRDDIADRVLMHSGAITANGGLPGSVLSEVHRWDNPVARFTITRTR